MKKLLFFTLALVVACTAAMAAPVDVMSAKIKALQCIQKEIAGGRLMSVGNSNPTLIKTEMGENSKAPVFYIFNTEQTFVIVSGDDRAEEILAVGDAPLNLDRIPANMQVWLDGYKEQLDWLLCNPDAKVERLSDLVKSDSHLKASSVSPMLTCNWDQSAPYYNQCKFTYNGRTYQCVTGCPATSAAMVMYYWKWPKAQVAALASYSGTLDIGSYYSNEVSFTYPSLPATTFDWANMKDTYKTNNYTTAQGTAVATLMRYVGQAEKMGYGVGASGISTTQTNNIANMYKTFGYDSGCRVVQKSSYSEANWAAMLQGEMLAGRPVVYCAVDANGNGGHAFNVDGYNAGENTYHINWGWSGDGNAYCAMNAFSTGTSSTGQSGGAYTFNQYQQMVIGITPPESAFEPELFVSPGTLSFMTSPGGNQVLPITLTAHNISNNVTVTVSGNNFKLLDDNNNEVTSRTIASSSLSSGGKVTVKVKFSCTTEGNYTGSVTFACNGTDSKTVQLNATADNSGSASDNYLNIAKYSTIDQAGYNTSYVNNALYVYAEDSENGVGWLKMPVYGAWTASYQASFNTGTHGQKWIKTNTTTHTASSTKSNGTYYQGTWNAYDVHVASTEFFTSSARAFGSIYNRSTTLKTVTFYVTNCTGVKLYGKNSSAAGANYPATMKIYECTKNGNSLTEGTTDVANITPNTNYNQTFNYEVTGLSANAIYKVETSCYMSYFYEIAFATPLPAIVTDKTGLGYIAGPGETQTNSFTLTGNQLTEDVTATITGDAAEYFSLEETTFDYNDVMIDGVPVTVTFAAPEETGLYEAKLTLTSGDLTKELTLQGLVAEKGSAQGEYLDIQKYATLDASGWQNSDELSDVGIKKVYDWTEDVANLEAWLTIPAATAALGGMYDDQMWIGFGGDPYLKDITWSASAPFKGSSNYYNSGGYGIGAQSASSSSNTTNAGEYFCVTNCTKVKAKIHNYYSSTNNNMYTYIMIFELYLDENGNVTGESEDYLYGTYNVNQNQEIAFEYDALDPEKAYLIYVAGPRMVLEEMAFCTPLPALPGKPTNVEASPAVTSADISWTPGKNNNSWNLRWRPLADPIETNRLWDFEDESQANEFTMIDSDNDGYTWEQASGQSSHSGTGVMCSASYISSGALTPDNWLITPKIKLGGSVSFWYCGQDPSYAAEKFQVYIYQGDEIPTNVSSFTSISNKLTATGTMQQFTADLSSYSGVGYIAIRHYDVTDMFRLNIDDLEVLVPNAVDWTYCNNVTSPYTIEGLTPETTYEVQAQGVNSLAASAWAPNPALQFTTLPAPVTASLATIESEGVKGNSYIISDELVVVLADFTNGVLYCKDQGNASINPSSIIDGQIDFMNDASLTGTTGQCGRAWDQSNWVALKFPADESITTLFNGIEGKKIKAGTVTGRYIDNSNYTIEVQPVNGNYTLTFNGTLEYTPNVYCCANFLESNLNIGGNTGAVGPHGDHYFFMNPKIQEVCEITYAMWNGEMFVTPSNTSIQGALHVDWSHNSIGAPTLQEGKTYRFKAIVSHPAKLSELKGGGTPSDNFVVYPANLSGDSNIVTGINGVYSGGHGEVVGVEYVNSLGVVSKTPFQGVNIVVTRYSNGSATTSKKIFK
jgi:hypothetical protein